MLKPRNKNKKLEGIKYFKETDNWGDINKISRNLIEILDELQENVITHSKIYIAPDHDAGYLDIKAIKNPSISQKLHSLGLSIKIYVQGDFISTLLQMLTMSKIGNIMVHLDKKWKVNGKILPMQIEFDIRSTTSPIFSLYYTYKDNPIRKVSDFATSTFLFSEIVKNLEYKDVK